MYFCLFYSLINKFIKHYAWNLFRKGSLFSIILFFHHTSKKLLERKCAILTFPLKDSMPKKVMALYAEEGTR